MPTATLTFYLPEEHVEHLSTLKGGDAIGAIRDLDDWLRNQLKHNDRLKRTERAAFECVRGRLREIVRERHLGEVLGC